MIRALLVAIFGLWISVAGTSDAMAGCTLPYVLQNGQTADATQVMGNFNALVNCSLTVSGGFLNRFRNGTFDVWQRGTTVTIGSSGSYGPDGWKVFFTGSSSVTVSALSGQGNAGFYVANLTGAKGNADIKIGQRIESFVAAPLAGQTVTVQFLFSQNTGSSVAPKVSTCFAGSQDNFSTCTGDLAPTAVTNCASGAYCTEAYTFTASPSAINGYEVDLDCNANFTSSQNCRFALADIRVTPSTPTGINPTPPPPELRPIGVEFQFCQRYLQVYGGAATATQLGTGWFSSSTLGFVSLLFTSQLRASPTMSISSVTAVTFPGTGNSTAVSFLNATAQSTEIQATVSGAAAGTPTNVNLASPATIMASAEL